MFAAFAKDFSFRYTGEKTPVIKNARFTVNPGELVLLAGKCGSGKSTLLKQFVPCLAHGGEKEGILSVFGQPPEVSENVSYVSGTDINFVFDGCFAEIAFPLENAGIDPRGIKLRVAEISELFGITPFIRKKVSALSGGQRVRAALAAACVTAPRLLLADEPCGQLDSYAADVFVNTVKKLCRENGAAALVAEHDTRVLRAFYRDCDKILVLENGAVTEVTDKDAFYREFCKLTAEPCAADIAAYSAAVVLKRLWFAYDRHKDVICGACATFGYGCIYAVAGGNGSGKSTLLKIIAGILKPDTGRAVIHGTAAYLPQDVTLIPDDNSYDLYGGKSAGERQMYALDGIFNESANILLMDEPCLSLDAGQKSALYYRMREYANQGGCVIFSSHDRDFRALADKILTLFDGELI